MVSMQRLTGFVWEITSSNGETWRVRTEGPNLEEGISEFRRLHGYSEILSKVKYLPRYSELNKEEIG